MSIVSPLRPVLFCSKYSIAAKQRRLISRAAFFKIRYMFFVQMRGAVKLLRTINKSPMYPLMRAAQNAPWVHGAGLLLIVFFYKSLLSDRIRTSLYNTYYVAAHTCSRSTNRVMEFANEESLFPSRSLFAIAEIIFSLIKRRILSEIIATNSLFVGFPRSLCTVYPK